MSKLFRSILSTVFTAGIFTSVLAQKESYNTSDQSVADSAKQVSVVIADPKVERYINMMDSLDKISLKSTGYRIQIYSVAGPNARQSALQTQSEFLKLYSKTPSYTNWSYPNWVVRLGDFRTHLEAQEFHEEIRTIYPASFIVKDEIQPTPKEN